MEPADYFFINTAEELRREMENLSQHTAIGFDSETTSLDPYGGRMRLVQLAAPDGVRIIDLDRFAGEGDASMAEALEPLRRLLAAPRPVKIAHNAKFDAKWTRHHLGVELGGVFDTLLASQLVSAGEAEDRHSLASVAERYLDEAVDKSEQLSDWSGELSAAQLEYAARDAAVMLPLREKLIERLRASSLVRCATLEFECVLPVSTIELTGIFLDAARWREQLAIVEKRRAILAEELQAMLAEESPQHSFFGPVRMDINLDSHVQLTKALKRRGIEVPDGTRNWKLQPLADKHEEIKKLLEYRTVQKALTSYGENILNEINPATGRIHANFHQIGAPTGRMACLAGDTLVFTTAGFKRMKDIREGDEVKTSYGFKKVQKAWMNGVRQLYRIRLRDGRTIRATADHRFLAGRADTWKRLDELQPGEAVYVSLNVPDARRGEERCQIEAIAEITDGVPTPFIIPGARLYKEAVAAGVTEASRAGLKPFAQYYKGRRIKDESVKKLIGRFGMLPSLQPVAGYLDRELRPVAIESVTLDGIEEVYDITVEDVHEFVADGIVVHNCTSPNIQQVPHAVEYRRCFRAPEGRKLLISDYSQIELRILADYTGDQGFIDAFQSGADLHRVTAAQVFNVPLEAVTKEQRDFAKRLNFGVVYGIGAQRFSMMTGLSLTDAEDILRRYFSTYRALDRWLREAAQMAVRERMAPRTVAGRLARFNFDPEDRQAASLAQRNGKNSPIQGCLSYDTRIFTESDGYTEIGKLDGRKVKVWDGSKFVNAQVSYSGKKQKVKVEFWGGYYIECSPEHKFLTIDVNGRQSWRTSSQFVKGCWVVLSNPVPQWGRRLSFPASEIGKAHNASRASLADMRDRADLGLWLGRLASDGSLGERQLRLLVAEHEEDLLPELRRLCESFGHVSYRIGKGGKGEKAIHELTVSAFGLCKQLNAAGVKTRIPDFAWQSSQTLAGYLRGMFDGDGTAHPDGPVLTFGQGGKHLRWAREIQQALLLLGVRCRINVCADRVNVCVLKRDSALFAQKIGFLNPRKQAQVEAINSAQEDGKIYGRAARIKLVEVTDEWVDMYDVVDSDTERFMANGLITHNSSADILKRALRLLHDRLKDGTARVVNVVHDEIVVEADADEAEAVAKTVEEAMCAAGEEFVKKVPVKVESQVADEWVK